MATKKTAKKAASPAKKSAVKPAAKKAAPKTVAKKAVAKKAPAKKAAPAKKVVGRAQADGRDEVRLQGSEQARKQARAPRRQRDAGERGHE